MYKHSFSRILPILFAITQVIDTPSYALIVKSSVLSRNQQQIVLFGDVHNGGTQTEVKAQSQDLVAFLSRIASGDRASQKPRFLHENPSTYTSGIGPFKCTDFEEIPPEVKFHFEGVLSFTHKVETCLSSCKWAIEVEYRVNADCVTDWHYILPILDQFSHLDSRSIDPRWILFDPLRRMLIKKNEPMYREEELLLGCAYSGVKALTDAREKMEASDFETLRRLQNRILEDEKTQKWIEKVIQNSTHSHPFNFRQMFNKTQLAHTVDIVILTDILSHKEQPIIVYAGMGHTDWLREKLLSEFGYSLEKEVGLSTTDENFDTFVDFTDGNFRVHFNAEFDKIRSELKWFFESFSFKYSEAKPAVHS